MNNIQLLYTVGCSFTRNVNRSNIIGEDIELVSLDKQWPHLLGDRLNVPTINDGFWGSSNQRSFRRLKNFLETKSIPSQNVLVLAQMTYPARFEMENDGIPVQDYSWVACDYQEDHIRLNPGWWESDIESFDFQNLAENHPRLFSCVCLPRDKRYSEQVKDGLIKVQGKTTRYSKTQEDLDEFTYICAIQGLMDSYGVNGHIIFGDKSNDKIQEYYEKNLRVMDSMSIRGRAGEHNTLDNFHPDITGNEIVADHFYAILTEDTDDQDSSAQNTDK